MFYVLEGHKDLKIFSDQIGAGKKTRKSERKRAVKVTRRLQRIVADYKPELKKKNEQAL